MYYIRPVKVNIPQICCHIYGSVFIRHKKNTMEESLTVRKQKHDQDAFLSLLHTYVIGNYDQDNKSRLQTENTSGDIYRPYHALNEQLKYREVVASRDHSVHDSRMGRFRHER
ncbi:hypothetical protein PsorP6_017158 [Peronosclerospora sorghi]|uniref:Uncharacterized protein n=1 Tax=Peronosclerospora sorghi TaxID=230839 RepID=A0ACC0WDN1_9STRA|nr:hypothetical protein PsorP6_017158 [Peronosclerospora sorghi]